MQKPGKLQAVILILVVVLAAGCAATKEYTSKLFKPANEPVQDSQAVALRFLELDQLDGDREDWVSTDIINGQDTISLGIELDNLSAIKPANRDSAILTKKEAKPQESEPVAKKVNTGEVRTKRTRE